MINQIRKLNNKFIERYTKAEDNKAVIKHRIIEQILLDDACFEKLSIERAADILRALEIEDWKPVYIQLLKK